MSPPDVYGFIIVYLYYILFTMQISREKQNKKEKTAVITAVLYACVGIALSSRAASSQVLSALMSLTTVFGMGTGGPSSLKTPTYAYGIPYSFHSVLVLYTNKLVLSIVFQKVFSYFLLLCVSTMFFVQFVLYGYG